MPGAPWDTTGRAAHTLPPPSECPADQPPFPVSDPCTVPPAFPLPPLHPAAVGDAPADWRACSAPRRSLSAHQIPAQPPLVCAAPALQISGELACSQEKLCLWRSISPATVLAPVPSAEAGQRCVDWDHVQWLRVRFASVL